jgi:hypothetical protein
LVSKRLCSTVCVNSLFQKFVFKSGGSSIGRTFWNQCGITPGTPPEPPGTTPEPHRNLPRTTPDPPGTTPEPPRNHHGTIRNHTGTIPEASSLLPSCFPLASLHVLHFFKENKQNREEAPLPGPLYSGPDNVLPPKGARITALQMWSFETICSKS